MKHKSLENLRSEIDALDQKIQLLIANRADLAAEVALVNLISKALFIVLKEKLKFLAKLLKEIKAYLKIKILH